jgi:hypothetical protein
MPSDACLFFHPCSGCNALLRPEAGHCCVFCSFGTVVCPPMQSGGAGSRTEESCCAAVPKGARSLD